MVVVAVTKSDQTLVPLLHQVSVQVVRVIAAQTAQNKKQNKFSAHGLLSLQVANQFSKSAQGCALLLLALIRSDFVLLLHQFCPAIGPSYNETKKKKGEVRVFLVQLFFI